MVGLHRTRPLHRPILLYGQLKDLIMSIILRCEVCVVRRVALSSFVYFPFMEFRFYVAIDEIVDDEKPQNGH